MNREPFTPISCFNRFLKYETFHSALLSFFLETESVELRGTTSRKKRMWSKAEVAAVIRHFKVHIAKGHLATISECLKCKSAEEPVLHNRSAQNIRDFVRNRGVAAKRSRYESTV